MHKYDTSCDLSEYMTLPLVVCKTGVPFPGTKATFEPDSYFRTKKPINYNQFLRGHEYIFIYPLHSFAIVPAKGKFDEKDPPVSHDSFIDFLSGFDKDGEGYSKIGTVAKVLQTATDVDGNCRIAVDCISRAVMLSTEIKEGLPFAKVRAEEPSESNPPDSICRALMRDVLKQLQGLIDISPDLDKSYPKTASKIEDPGKLADYITDRVIPDYKDRRSILQIFDPKKRLERLILMLSEKQEVAKMEADIRDRVKKKVEQNQRDYFIRQQIFHLKSELGDEQDENDYAHKIQHARLPEQVKKKLLRENDRLKKMSQNSPEASMLENYIETCLALPWYTTTIECTGIRTVKRQLDQDHSGLEKVKERILEYIAVRNRTPRMHSQILCLVGAPGIGKTSIAESIATAVNRNYVRVSLGGVHDESDIRGHRRTYVASMPGRIINALIQAKSRNPLILLDEIDKMSNSGHGDPSSAMLEVLDPEQNRTFRDHYIEMPFDLSGCMFIATANSLDHIPRPLLDRMEVIALDSYTRDEKFDIAKKHLIPKQLKRNGLNSNSLHITDGALRALIDEYTREAGVRQLERAIATLMRKGAKRMAEDKKLSRVTFRASDLPAVLGARKIQAEPVEPNDCVGLVSGLAWTEIGGDRLCIEVAILPGSGKLELTGHLGDIMKESAKAALTYVRSIAADYGIPEDFYKTKDIHVHVPEGAIPKDGPSAGIAIMTAMVSALSGIPVRHDVAMTGEITLRGRVLPIGGLREKAYAAATAGISTVLIPEANRENMENLSRSLQDKLHFVLCHDASDVLANALARTSESAK